MTLVELQVSCVIFILSSPLPHQRITPTGPQWHNLSALGNIKNYAHQQDIRQCNQNHNFAQTSKSKNNHTFHTHRKAYQPTNDWYTDLTRLTNLTQGEAEDQRIQDDCRITAGGKMSQKRHTKLEEIWGVPWTHLSALSDFQHWRLFRQWYVTDNEQNLK